MVIVHLLVNENLLKAEFAFNQAESGNIIELCREYLLVLAEYRRELHKLRETPEMRLQQQSALARELTGQVKRAIRSAVEITTREHNEIKALLESFTAISGYQAADTFNRLKYKGFDDWTLRANAVYPQSRAENERMNMEEAVEAASQLRREEYVAHKLRLRNEPKAAV